MSALHRYPGVKPFEAAEAALFFGRERDQADLLGLVGREKLIALFGKSGYGKSSLIKAGLIPDLLDNPAVIFDPYTSEQKTTPNFPVYIRFNLYGRTGRSTMPRNTLVARFREQAGKNDADAKLRTFFQENDLDSSLWTVFKSSKTAAEQRIFLIFDQFEEFFSYPNDAQLAFRQELSELLYTRIPQAVRDRMDMLDRDTKRLLHQPLDIHTLFVIRADRMHQLNSMREELPAILHTRFELKALNEQQAEDAIVKPAKMTGDGFLLREPFSYEPAALKKILSELCQPADKTPDPEAERAIEAFQLQMVCQTIEQRLIDQTQKAGGVQPTTVREADLPDFNQIYEQYYTDKLTGLPDENSRRAAHVLLEEVMVIGEEMATIRRVSMDKDLLIESMQQNHRLRIDQALLDYLEDKFLIRREAIGGRIHYEVSHDVLLGPLLKSRDASRQAEARALAAVELRAKQAEAEERAKKAEQMAEHERLQRQIAERRRRRARLLAAASIAGFLLAAITGFWAVQQKNVAEKAYENQKRAEADKAKQEFYSTLSDIEAILEAPEGCPDSIQRHHLDSLPPLYLDDQVLQNKVRALKQKIEDKNCQ